MSQIDELLTGIRRQASSSMLVAGPTELEGSVRIQGSKNTALKIIPALAGFSGRFRLFNVPVIIDTLDLFAILVRLGASVDAEPDVGTFVIDTRSVSNQPIPFEITKRTTTAFYFAGALLGRFGSVDVGKPGGDEIGARPFDMHLEGFRRLGADVEEHETSITANLCSVVVDARVALRMPSAGATVNVLLAAAASGAGIIIENVPHDADMRGFYAFLRCCGLDIRVLHEGVACNGRVRSIPSLVTYRCPPDRNDTFTWLAAGTAWSRSGIRLTGVDCEDMRIGIEELAKLGARVSQSDTGSLVVRRPSSGLITPFAHTVIAGPSPMFSTDWAPLLQLVLATASGTAKVVDCLHSDRTRQAFLLTTMGAAVTVAGGPPPNGVRVYFRVPPQEARYIFTISGPTPFNGIAAEVGNDVRACATALIAAIGAHGASELRGIAALFRGYENFASRLRALGADITERM